MRKVDLLIKKKIEQVWKIDLGTNIKSYGKYWEKKSVNSLLSLLKQFWVKCSFNIFLVISCDVVRTAVNLLNVKYLLQIVLTSMEIFLSDENTLKTSWIWFRNKIFVINHCNRKTIMNEVLCYFIISECCVFFFKLYNLLNLTSLHFENY